MRTEERTKSGRKRKERVSPLQVLSWFSLLRLIFLMAIAPAISNREPRLSSSSRYSRLNNGLTGLTEQANDDGLKAQHIKTLQEIYSRIDEPNKSTSYSKLSEALDISKPTVKNHIEKLEQADCLEVDRSATPYLYLKTTAGKTVLNSATVSESGVNDSSQSTAREPVTNVHDLAYELYFSDRNSFKKKNKETLLKTYQDILGYDEETKEFYGDWDRFHFRISGDKVVIYERGKEEGLNATYVKNQAIQDLERCKEWLEENLNLEFDSHRVIQGKVISQDVAIEDHPLVQAAENSDLEIKPDKFHSSSEHGEISMVLDKSHGEKGELESMMRGKFSGNGRLEETAIQRELDWIVRRAANPEVVEKLWDFGKKLTEIDEDDRVTDIGSKREPNEAEKEELDGEVFRPPRQKGSDVPETTDFSESDPKTVRLSRCDMCGELAEIEEKDELELVDCGCCQKTYYRSPTGVTS